jgi:hypothetical protein
VNIINYIKEIKAFNDLVQVKQLSTGQIALWYALMYVNNKCAWIEWFTVPNMTLELHTGMSRKGIYKARNILKQHNIIDFSSNGTKATSYKLISLQNSTQDSTQVDGTLQNSTQDSTQVGTQGSATLNKLNETKLNKAAARKKSDVDAPTTSSDLDIFANKIGDIYSKLTKKPIRPKDDMEIFKFAKSLNTRDIEIIKDAMIDANRRWKPKFDGDKIHSFKYFIPVIKEAISTKEGRKNSGGNKKGNSSNTEKSVFETYHEWKDEELPDSPW